MPTQQSQQPPPLPESFLRGLEADLRALCTDSRRKNPQVKDAAERVILALKQADTPDLKLQAADSAAAAFCAACESPPSSSSSSSSSSSLSTYIKVVLRAVSSLHKLLTHRAISANRLPEVLDALHRLALSPVDDTITLKVLQGLLSLLTVRTYAKTLSEDDLSRAFSLLFVLRTVHPSGPANPASKAISSAISQMSSSSSLHPKGQGIPHQELGVIEQTSKAAFRQASSDLFASAADAAVQTAVRMQVPSGEFIPLDDFPTEARSSYRFFMDLCNAVSGQPLSWLSHLSKDPSPPSASSPLGLDLSLALEVIDDGLSSSVGLFAAQPVFLDVLSKKLCPVIHELFTSPKVEDKASLKSLFALVVTVITHYWRNLPSESQELLHALVNICKPHLPKRGNLKPDPTSATTSVISWNAVYAMEAMRCVMRAQAMDAASIVDVVQDFELSEWSTNPISAMISVACDSMDINFFPASASQIATQNPFLLPNAPITGSLKPFAKTIVNSYAYLASTAVGLYVHLVRGAKLASNYESDSEPLSEKVAKALLEKECTRQAIEFIGKALQFYSFIDASPSVTTRLVTSSPNSNFNVADILARSIADVCIVANDCGMSDIRMQTFSTLASVSAAIVQENNALPINPTSNNTSSTSSSASAKRVPEKIDDFEKRLTGMYNVLFDVVARCRESLGRSWSAAVDSFDVLDAIVSDQLQQQKQQKTVTSKPGASTSVEKKTTTGSELSKSPSIAKATAQSLKQRLDNVFESANTLSWAACHDLISALVQCSRQSMVSLSKKPRNSASGAEDVNMKSASGTEVTKSSALKNVRVFGIAAAEKVILNALRKTKTNDISDEPVAQGEDVSVPVIDPMPSTLWELLAGHLTSVCADSSHYALRMYALNSLTKIACKAVAVGDPETGKVTVAHEKIITPFLDLFNSSHSDVRSGSLSSIYTILETQGEKLHGEAAWRVVLSILTTAAGSKANAKVKESSTPNQAMNKPVGGIDEGKMISEGFKVVKVIADDFLSSLATNSLPSWLDVLGLYCRQEDDINVALTSIGLLWRTADFLAKKSMNRDETMTEDEVEVETKMENWLWIEVFTILKEVSTDERPEIRNCAVKTLTGALTAHSVRLSARAWSGCVRSALLPLLENVMKGGVIMPPNVAATTSTSSSAEASKATKTSKDYATDNEIMNVGVSGIAVIDEEPTNGASTQVTRTSSNVNRSDAQVMWHHSRDTPRKQWNETRVLALGGVAKVLRSAMPRLSELLDEGGRPLFLTLTDDGANGLWRKMLRAAGVAAASRDGEVAIAGVSTLLEMLEAAGLVVAPQNLSAEADNPSQQLEASTSAPVVPTHDAGRDANSSGSVGVVASMSWIIGSVSPTPQDRNSEEVDGQGADDDTQKNTTEATKGTIMLWEAVWSALVEAICGVSSSERSDGGSTDEAASTKIVDDKALQMLAGGLMESRRKLEDKFTQHSSRLFVQVLLHLARGNSAAGETEAMIRVQQVTLDGLRDLSLGGDEESWVSLVRGLLKLVPENGALANVRDVMVCRRVLGIVRSGYEGDEMSDVVKREILVEIIEVMGRIMMGHHRITDTAESARNNTMPPLYHAQHTNKPTPVGDKHKGDQDEGASLWMDGCDVLITAMRHGTTDAQAAGGPRQASTSKQWAKFAAVIERFLFGSGTGSNSSSSSSSVAGLGKVPGDDEGRGVTSDMRRRRQLYDMRVVACASDGVRRMRGAGDADSLRAKRALVQLVWRGAGEGERGGRRKFVRMCQSTLFSLAQQRSDEEPIGRECARKVVDMCARVLGKYIADGARNGRCPLPAERRAEAVFLLRQLRAMAIAVDAAGGADAGRKRVLALYPRLCECVESGDEAVRLLARELLDDASPSSASTSALMPPLTLATVP